MPNTKQLGHRGALLRNPLCVSSNRLRAVSLLLLREKERKTTVPATVLVH